MSESTNVERDPILSAALEYVQSSGWAVLPVHRVRDGECTCEDWAVWDCPNNGRHILPPTAPCPIGLRREVDIKACFKHYRDMNLGIETGEGLLALEVSKPHGLDTLAELERFRGALSYTVRIDSSKNLSLLFRYDDTARLAVKSEADVLPGISVAGKWDCAVVPPSVDGDGVEYRWLPSNAGLRVPYAPQWLLELIESDPVVNEQLRKEET